MRNLTERQKELVRWLVNEVQAGRLDESFSLTDAPGFPDVHGVIGSGGVDEKQLREKLERGAVEALRQENFLLVSTRKETAGTLIVNYRDFVLTGLAYEAVRVDFKGDAAASPASVKTVLDLVCKLVGNEDADAAQESRAAEQGVLASLTARGQGPSAAWAHHVSSAMKQLVEQREQILLVAVKKALRSLPASDHGPTFATELASALMADLARYYKHATAHIHRVAKLPGYVDGLPPDLREHETKTRQRLEAELQVLVGTMRRESPKANAAKHIASNARTASMGGMPYPAKVYRVMIASPSDVQTERAIAQEVIADWNAVHSEDRAIVLLPLVWERDSTPLQGDRPQGLINKQVLAKADVLVAIFHSRIGSPTGVASSGTIEELTEHLQGNKPAMIYFSEAPLPHNVDPEQLKALNAFRAEAQKKGLYATFTDEGDFRAKLAHHLAKFVVDSPLFATAGPTASFQRKKPSDKAATLLKHAVATDGHLLMASDHDGGTVQAGDRNFVTPGSTRSFAEWKGALQDLIEAGYAEDLGQGTVFQVTREGYDVADQL